MILKEVITKIERRFPPSQAESFDNVGLLCGRESMLVQGILICHDALEEVVEQAIQRGANLIVCFHPILFSPQKKWTAKDYVQRSVMLALENKIAIYALHTIFDNDMYGANYGISKRLGLQNSRILQPKQSQLRQLSLYVPSTHALSLRETLANVGAGDLGHYDSCSFLSQGKGYFRAKQDAKPFLGKSEELEQVEETKIEVVYQKYKEREILKEMHAKHPYEEVSHQILELENANYSIGLGRYGDLKEAMNGEEFLVFLKEVFQLSVIRHSTIFDKKIKRVGVLAGSGASAIASAKAVGCDAFVSGDFKYHDFFQAENQILLADIGHFESEQFIVEQLDEFFCKNFTKFAVSKTSINTNPVNYFL